MAGPLSHVRVLDLSRIMAGPWAGQILADLGADVVKVERTGAGDDTRGWGPPFLKDRSGAETREAGYYLSVNRGKRSITLELDKPEGQRVVRALAERSDIVLENFKVGTLARFGLGYEQLKAVNPEADLLLHHRLRPERAAPRRRGLRFHDPGHVRPHERHRRARRQAGRLPGKGRRADRRHHVGHVRGDLRAGGAGAAQRDRPRRLHRHRHARRRRRVPRQPGHELSRLRQGAAAHRQRPPQHPAAGRLRQPRRLHGAGGRQRRPVRQMLRGARTAGMGDRRALREECRTGAQPRGAEAADRRNPARRATRRTGSRGSKPPACPAARSTPSRRCSRRIRCATAGCWPTSRIRWRARCRRW